MSGFVQASLLLTLALFLGRLSGFFREIVLAREVGVSAAGDAAVLVLTLPDFLVGLLLAGGFNAALVPALRKLDARERQQLFLDTSFQVGVAFSVLAGLVVVFPGIVPAIFAPGLAPEVVAPYLDTFALMALSLPIAALTGVSAAFLNASNSFFIVGLGTLAFNVVLCVVLLTFFDPVEAFWALGFGVVAAALVRWGMQLLAARPRLKSSIYRPRQLSQGLAWQFAAGVGAMGLLVLAPVVFRTLLSFQSDGLLAAFNYAQKLYELPVALMFAPIVTVLLPQMAESYARNGKDHSLFLGGLVAVLVLACVTLFVGQLYGEAIATVIYQRGALDAAAMLPVIDTAQAMFFALPFAGSSLLSAAALNAQGRTMIVLRNTVAALVAATLLAVIADGAVMAGFVLFFALSAGGNMISLGADLTWAMSQSVTVRVFATVSLMVTILVIDLFLPANMPDLVRSLLGVAVFGLLVLIWVPLLRGVLRPGRPSRDRREEPASTGRVIMGEDTRNRP